ncbi:hypothetical protein C8Q75DRAFT_739469 [Abortiporus biennis]|nr:hypothetical protein C8Q75DRAFT_739469 [Abortiporus biennis]
MEVELGPIFLKLRTIAFSCISIVSLAWIILLSVDLYLRWDVSEVLQRNLVGILLLSNIISVIMLPVLLILPFRVWLDSARIFLLLIAHGGTAAGFSINYVNFHCPSDTPDGVAACNTIDMYILIGSWVNPTLMLFYALGLAIAVYRRTRIAPVYNDVEEGVEEKSTHNSHQRDNSVLPIMPPPPQPPITSLEVQRDRHWSFTEPRMSIRTDISGAPGMSRPSPSRHFSMPASVMPPLSTREIQIQKQRKQSLASVLETKSVSSGSRSSGRLSKPVPVWRFEQHT